MTNRESFFWTLKLHALMINRTHKLNTLQTKNGSFKIHTYTKSCFDPFWNKIKRLFLSLESSQENVHGGVHFWKSYWHCWLQLFRKEFHCSCLSGFFQCFLNKANEISCLCHRNVLRKMSMMGLISGTITDTAAHNFFKEELHCSNF